MVANLVRGACKKEEEERVPNLVRVGHRGWKIGPKIFRPEAYPIFVSSKLCGFILTIAIKTINKRRSGDRGRGKSKRGRERKGVYLPLSLKTNENIQGSKQIR